MNIFKKIYNYIVNLFNSKYYIIYRFTYSNGQIRYYDFFGHLHRKDGPAIIAPNGEKSWWWKGKLHRLNGPAIIDRYGNCSWWKHGKCHRIDGPAVIGVDGHQAWYVDGNLHRIGAPAMFNPSNGFFGWYVNGKAHRIDGPSADNRLGVYGREWAIYGRIYNSEKEYKERLRYLRFKYFYKWLFICDQPGKKLYEISLEKNYQEMKKII